MDNNKTLLRHLKNFKFTVFDFETTGLNLKYALPVQCGFIFSDKYKILEQEDLKILWSDNELNMSKGAADATNFNYKKWKKDALSPKEQFLKLNSAFEKSDFIVGHNVLGFDIHIYYNTCEKIGIKPIKIEDKVIDTLAFCKGLPEKLNIPYKNGENRLQYQLRMINISNKECRKRGYATLKTFCEIFDVKVDEELQHDALYDVIINAEGFKKMIYKVDV